MECAENVTMVLKLLTRLMNALKFTKNSCPNICDIRIRVRNQTFFTKI